MKLLIPIDKKELEDAKIITINEVVGWLCIEIEGGKISSSKVYDSSKDALEEWIDAVVVCGDFEPIMEFIEAQVMILVAHTQKEIDDIVEAFMFKELHELGF